MINFADDLISAIKRKQNPCVIGLDHHPSRMPLFVTSELARNPTPDGYRNAIGSFFKRIIETVGPLVPAVKPQISLLESLTWVGAQVFMDIVECAKQNNLIVIADAKRGDIASSAKGYAEAFLAKNDGPAFAKGYDADAMTVNAFLGRDTLDPFVELCESNRKGIFVLVKTSNKGSGETQDVVLQETGEPAYMSYASLVHEVGASLLGEFGYSSIGAVVGATFPQQAEQIRDVLPKSIILVPGYGAQGATAGDVARCFNADGLGAIVNASRSITHSSNDLSISTTEYSALVRDNTLRMIDDIVNAVDGRAVIH